jgi:hypothetical protein
MISKNLFLATEMKRIHKTGVCGLCVIGLVDSPLDEGKINSFSINTRKI